MSTNLIKLQNLYFSYKIRRRHSITSENKRVLESIDLNVVRGDRIGISGPNGSGKSSLLRLMAGIYKPTQGTISISGKVSLLSLQIGYDHQLTGRDNALLGGMLFGASYKQSKLMLDEIRNFSGLDDSFDLPLKTYSSGMRVRLGFAIASSYPPDALLVDEALSVGDTEFQKYCEERISELIENGMSLVLVSHSKHKLDRWTNKQYTLKNGHLIAATQTK